MSGPPGVAPVSPTHASGNGHGPPDGSFEEPWTPARRRHRPWYRRWAIWAVAGAVIVAATVVSDLPQPQTLGQQATAAAGVVKEIATGVHPCAYAVAEAFRTFLVPSADGTLSSTSRAVAHSYLSQDQQACSFENTQIFSMSTITVPNSPAGARLSALIKTVLEWSTSDANGAIVAIMALVAHPTDAKALQELASRERRMATDRAAAERDLRGAERDLHGAALPGIGLPAEPAGAPAAS